MNIKLKSILIVSLLLLSALIISYNTGSTHQDSNNDADKKSISKSKNRQSNNLIDWDPIEVISEPIFGQDNNVNESLLNRIVVENDKIYVVWEDKSDVNGAGGDPDIFYRYFDGSIWSDVQIISEPIFGGNVNNGQSTRPEIAVENGKIYVVWMDDSNLNGAGSDHDIYFRCNLSGSHWEDIQVISEPIYNNNINVGYSGVPMIEVENSKIYTVWMDNDNLYNSGSDEDIFYRCNLSGSNWEDIQILSEPVFKQDVNTKQSRVASIAVENGKIYVTWSDGNDTNGAGIDTDIFFKCNLTGTSWEPIQVISEPVFGQDFNVEYSFAPKIAVENSKIYIVWDDWNNTYGASNVDNDIFYRCNLTGQNWENIQVISEPSVGNNFNTGDNWEPQIAVENNKIYVVWTDENNTNGSGIDTDILFRCNLTGNEWEPVQVLSEPVMGKNINQVISNTPDITVKNDIVYCVWCDDNNTDGSGTDRDIFLRISSPPLYFKNIGVNPVLGNTSTNFNFTATYFHKYNEPPQNIYLEINGSIYSILETDPLDSYFLDGKNYFCNTTLDIGNNHTFQFFASDVNFTIFTKLFNKPDVFNTPPLILTKNNHTAYEDIYYEIKYQYSDIDVNNVGQNVFWKFISNASWSTFNPTTGVLFGTPGNDDVGVYWVNISISDNINITFTNFTLTVIEVNDNPIITTTNDQTAYEDELYEIDYEATDIDSAIENQTWSLSTDGNSWLGFDQVTGILNGTPSNVDVGSYWVNVTVEDGEGGIDYTNFSLEVLNVNDPPTIQEANISYGVVGKLFELDFNASDIDSSISKQTWVLTTNATWLTINSANGLLYGTPSVTDVGWYNVNITVSDGDGGFDWYEFILHVFEFPVYINNPPDILTADDTSAVVNEYYSTDYNAIDDHTSVNDLKWYLSTNASWLTIDLSSGLLRGTPSINDVGTYWVSVSVFDGEDGWDYHNFTLKVTAVPITENHAPVLSNPEMEPSEGSSDTNFTFSIHYFDEDNNEPKYVRLLIGGKMYEMELDSGEKYNGTYKCNIRLKEGTHSYYIIAFDGLEIVRTEDLVTPEIMGREEISSDESSIDWWIWMILIIVIIMILLIIFFLFINKKKHEKDTVVEERLIEEPRPIEQPEEQQAQQLQSLPEGEQIPSSVPSDQIAQIASPAVRETQEQATIEDKDEE